MPFKKQLMLATISGIVMLGTLCPIARAETDGTAQLHLHSKRTPDDKEQLTAESMLSDLRDLRLSIGQLKQQAVNLFLESTRSTLSPKDPPMPPSPTVITAKMIVKNKKYLPPRKEWLVYYVNTLDPIVQLLIDDINDVDTSDRVCPKPVEAKVNPLWETWKSDVMAIRKSVQTVQELIEPDSGTNDALSHEALFIFEKASHLERTRARATQVLQKYYLEEEKQSAG